MINIKFCENNFVHGTDDVVEKLRVQDNIEVEVYPCLGHCGDCAQGPYALVDDELIKADTAEELYEKIKSMI